jgi:hypothetical protein
MNDPGARADEGPVAPLRYRIDASRMSGPNRRPTAYKAVGPCTPWPPPATMVTRTTTSSSAVPVGYPWFAPRLMPQASVKIDVSAGATPSLPTPRARARSCSGSHGQVRVGRTPDPSSSNLPASTRRVLWEQLQRDHLSRQGQAVGARPDTGAVSYRVAMRIPGRDVEAWSSVRLPFEPRGWHVDFRRDLAHACRTIAAGPRQVLP